MTIWFTSDSHYFHDNIIKYAKRPYNTIEDMNEALINKWNNIVKDDDTVFHLGDFCFNKKQYKPLLKRLKGHIVHIKGNHDRSSQTRIKDLTLAVNNKIWQLIHNPAEASNNIVICGHVHNSFHVYKDKEGILYVNVGVDVNDYTPISLEQVMNLINNFKDNEPFNDNHHIDELKI